MRKKRNFSYRTDWPPERVTAMLALWDAGLTGGQVAQAMGGGLTRCAVLGKLWRLGIKRDTPTLHYTPPKSMLPLRPVLPAGIDLLDLRAHHCRWPSGNYPPYSFCGKPVLVGWGVYCPSHAAIAYRHHVRA